MAFPRGQANRLSRRWVAKHLYYAHLRVGYLLAAALWAPCRRGVRGLEVVRAVLHPEQVARGALAGGRRRRPAEAELRPADADQPLPDPGEVADGVHRDLRVVGAGLDAQVATAAGRVDLLTLER